MNQDYMDKVMANTLKQANDMQSTIDAITRMQSITTEIGATTHNMVERVKTMTADLEQIRDNIANFDDFFRPLRYCGEHSIVIYLAFFLPMAASRSLLLKSGLIADLGTVSVLVTLCGVLGALVLYWAVRRTPCRRLPQRTRAGSCWRRTPRLGRSARACAAGLGAGPSGCRRAQVLSASPLC